MSSIRIDIDYIRNLQTSCKLNADKLQNVGAGLASLRNNVDSSIQARRSIASRISSLGNSTEILRSQMNSLQSFITYSADSYSNIEKYLVKEALCVENRSPNRPLSSDSSFISSSQKEEESEKTSNLIDQAISLSDLYDNVGKVKAYAQSILGVALMKAINFKVKRNGTIVLHVADWVKGKGSDNIFKSIAKSVNKGIRGINTNRKVSNILTKVGMEIPNNFPQWVRGRVSGTTLMTVSSNKALAKSIAKKIFPIEVGFNIIGEGLKLSEKKDLNGLDVTVAASNVVVKSAFAYGGAVLGGTALAFLGPPGVVAGAFIGGSLGTWIGDFAATGVEKGIRWVSKFFK